MAKARRGIKAKVSTRRNKASVIYITQAYGAGVIFETVDSGTPMGSNIRARASRVAWPTVDRNQGQITAGIALLVAKAERTIQGRLD